jgi:translocation and assembly module TamA
MIRRFYATWLVFFFVLWPALARAGIEVVITGLGSDERGNAMARLSIREQANASELDESMVQRLNRQAPQEIREAMQPFGWYEATVQSDLSGSAPNWTARYHVVAGPYVRVETIDVEIVGEGKDFDGIARVIRRIPLHKDERLKHTDYENSKTQILSAAYNAGFLDAQWERHELVVDPSRLKADVHLRLNTGPRYYFGAIRIEQSRLDPEFIQRYIVLKPGDPFLAQQVLDQQFALGDLDYFDSVEIEPQRAETDAQHRIPLVVKTEPRNRSRYEFGVGYGTDTGARMSAGTEWRQINSQGHKIFTDIQLSQIKDTLSGEYRVPLGDKPTENLSFTATDTWEQLNDGESLSYGLGAALNRSPGDWQRKLYIQYLHEETDFGSEDTQADLFMPGVAFTRTQTDDPIRARQGWYLFTDVHGADKTLLSTANFVQVHAVLRTVMSPLRRFRLLGRAEWGASYVGEFDDLPASQRFFAGGDQSVRGYAYQSIGPRNSEGDVVGGKYLTVLSGEAEYRVWGDWAAAAFIDAGGADDDPGPKLYRGVGLGVRYRAPIGDLQIDFAHPLDGEDTRGVRIHFGVRVGL